MYRPVDGELGDIGCIRLVFSTSSFTSRPVSMCSDLFPCECESTAVFCVLWLPRAASSSFRVVLVVVFRVCSALPGLVLRPKRRGHRRESGVRICIYLCQYMFSTTSASVREFKDSPWADRLL